MEGESRVAWSEGMFLRPQHFQQQDRFFDKLARGRADTARPHPWGVTDLQVNADLLALGKFAVVRCSGVTPDGLAFSIPGDLDPPDPLDVPGDAKDAVVSLTLPPRQPGAVEFAERGGLQAAASRFIVDELSVADAFSAERTQEPIEIARPNLRYGVTRDQTYGRACLGLARVREVVNGQVFLDDGYIPPCLDLKASPVLAGFLSDILGRAQARIEELSLRAVEATDGGAETFASFLLLQALNRYVPQLAHLKALPMVHPERLFEVFVMMAGELATFVRADRRSPDWPDYDHEDLKGCFGPVVDALQAALSAMFDRSAVQLDLKLAGPGAYVSAITDRNLYQSGFFYLAVTTRKPADEVRARFGSQAKVGSVQKMRQIVDSALPGVPLRHVPTPPPQIRVLPGYVYFELDRSSPDWRDFATAPALGLHVSGEWPDLRLELWCVKRQNAR